MALLALLACGGGSTKGSGTASSPGVVARSVLQRVELDERPPLSLVEREGDPRGAVAFVGSHTRGSAASAALAGLLASRLEASGLLDIEVRAHALGVELSLSFEDPGQIQRFIRGVHAALRTEVRPADLALQRAKAELEALRGRAFIGPAEATAAACSGELGHPDPSGPLDLSNASGIANLDAARTAIYRTTASAFAALGPRATLSAAQTALSDDDDWPTDSADVDPWPPASTIGVDQAKGARRLALALRLPDAEAAAYAAQSLSAPGSELMQRLETLSPGWQLERSVAVARRRGACLRVDIAPAKGDPGPSAKEIALAAVLSHTAVSRALENSQPGALDEGIVSANHPRRAAVLAAWRVLPSETPDDPTRRTLSYVADPSDRIEIEGLGLAVAEVERRLSQPSFELSARIEAGQGEIWMLLASPCGTGVENEKDAGARALLFRAISSREPQNGVRLEPWTTPDGVGILAHGRRKQPDESPDEQARRVAAELGRAMTRRLSGTEIGNARAELLAELGERPFPGWALLLDGLAPGHPSWLDPRGTWSTVSDLSTESLDQARRIVLSAPLRLAVLANDTQAQATRSALELESWLVAARQEVATCPSTIAQSSRRGEVTLEAGVRPLLEGAYVGIVFSEPGPRGARAAELTAMFLNRPGGPLHRALDEARSGASARALALGGEARPALAIHVRALPDRISDALGKVRALLDGLARGSLGGDEFTAMSVDFARENAQARFDPRRRIVDLWRGAQAPELSLGTLRAAHAALAAASHWVVTAEVLDSNKARAH